MMANHEEDDVYFDAISTGGPPASQTANTENLTSAEETTPDNNLQHNQVVFHTPGHVADIVNKFKGCNINQEKPPEIVYPEHTTGNPEPKVTDTSPGETSPNNTGSPDDDISQHGASPTFVVSDITDKANVYSFAKPFAEGGTSENVGPSVSEKKVETTSIDEYGYSHAVKDTKESGTEHTDIFQSSSPSNETVNVTADSEIGRMSPVAGQRVGYHDDNLYDTVGYGGFEIVTHDQINGSNFGVQNADSGNQPGSSQTGEKEMMRKLAEGINHEWKRKEAKKRSRALKRPSKEDKGGNPFTQHSRFDDPHDGAIPEAEDEAPGHHFNPFSEHNDSGSGSSSYYTDSSFDTMSSDSDHLEDDDFFPNKPLPPRPEKHNQIKDLAQRVLPGHHKNVKDDETPILEPVMFRRPRKPPSLPENQGTISQSQVKLRGVLQSLIDSERNYIKSLERLRDVYMEHILSLTKKAEIKVTFRKVEEIISIHQMFQIEFSDKLKKWNAEEKIGSIFHVFSQRMVVNIYSDYVNNYEAASESIKELENSKQAFKEFLKRKQMESDDRLSIAGLMLKPIQRFPQFIMIIKDLLKHTDRDHHDREQLQEAVTWIENVAHQLNERKRQSEQFYHGNQIMSKLAPRSHMEKNIFLIRQDDMEQHSQDPSGSQFKKQRRLFLMNDRLFSVHVPQRDGVDRYIYKWHQSLLNLELNTSAVTPNMQTKINIGESHSTIVSPKTETPDEDPYNVASDLTDMMHDISVLAKIQQLTTTLKCPHQGISDDQIQGIMVTLQKAIQAKDYQLQMLNSNTIILQDKVRNKKYVFSASSAKVKQEWCIDFLLAKYSLDVINIPSWHKADGSDNNQPALLMRHMSVDMQRTFTKTNCAVKVYFPRKSDVSEEHLWICSSNEGQGQVSIVSLHTHKPSLIESFQATRCEILCAESVSGFATVNQPTAFEEDTVWMSTANSVIQVFMLSAKQADLHRRCIHTFNVGCMIITMKSIDDCVLCGNRSGTVIAFTRDDDGVWSETERISLGIHPITSIICVGDNAWVVCGSYVYIIDVDTCEIQGKMDHQLTTKEGETKNFQYLVKTGVGVWASFIGQPNICLYHCESKRLLQDFNICSAINEFVKVYTGNDEKKSYYVTCLMVSLGMLWVGTNDGLILVYPLPRLRDGVPRINERPQVALHSHRGPVKFLVPVHYGPLSGTPIRRRPSSVLHNYKVDESVIRRLPQMDRTALVGDEQPIYLELRGDSLKSERLYEDVKFQGYHGSQIYEELENVSADKSKQTEEKPVECVTPVSDKTDLENSAEHTYFVLEAQANTKGRDGDITDEVKSTSDSKNEESGAADNVGKLQTDESLLSDLENITKRPKPSEDEVKLRKKNRSSDLKSFTLSLQDTRSRPFPRNFQSELKNKLKSRKSMEDLTDRDATEADVDILYPTLLRPRSIGHFNQSNRDSRMSASVPDDLPGFVGEPTYMRPRMSTPIQARKPDMSSVRRKSIKDLISTSDQGKRSSTRKESRRSVSFNKGTESLERPQKTQVGSSFTPGSSVDTLRKQDTNTILVLSGGDGYKDWKKRQGQNTYRQEEPCLLFWMYRF